MIDYSLDTNQPVILIGAGGHSRIIMDCLKISGAKVIAHFDHRKSEWLEEIGVNYIDENQLNDFASHKLQMVMSFIGSGPKKLETRFHEMENLAKKGALFPNIIHPTAVVSKECSIGMGVQILAGAVVNANVKLDNGCIINSNATVEHDTLVGKGVHVAPNATVLGQVQVGDYAYVGSSSVLIQKSIVQKRSFIKALSLYQSN
ncbi:MAG TPA: hypothetical protein QF353_01750 [Gammaproteobacteria bacterium]|nr:hypothetical protein [Gammaproteobacteria bacterium]